jgi:hypothetical protein
MKQFIFFVFVAWVNISKAQSLTLSPDATPPTLIKDFVNGYKHSNLTNSSVLNASIVASIPTIQTLTNSDMSFTVNDGSGLMWLSKQGYLSLGSTVGAERLDIKNGRVRFTGQKAAGQPSGYVFTDMSGTQVFRLEMKDDDNLRIVQASGEENFVMNVNTGNVGVNTAPSAERLTISGNVHNTQLEAVESGINPILATATGDLVKGAMNKIDITPWNYTRFGGMGNNDFTITSGLGFYTINTPAAVELSAPVHFPNGVKIKSIKVNLVDNSATSYIRIDLLGVNNGSTTYLGNISSKNSAASPSLIELTDDPFFHTTDCAANYYIISVNVLKNSDDTSASWTGANFKIGTITFNYAY